MVTCAVSDCRNTSGKISKTKDGITFHRFPRDAGRRKQWELAVNREEHWVASASSTVCSEHFDASDFYLTESGLRRLSINAVPVINISPCQVREPSISEMLPIDIKPTDSEEVVKLKFKVKRLELISEDRKRRLNLMWQGKRRLRKKLKRMKLMIQHLIKVKKEQEQNSCVGLA